MNILGYEYSLIEEGDSDMIGAFGRLHVDHQVLQIAEGLAQQQRESTVLHEAIEAVGYHLGLQLDHNVIMCLETSLYQILTSNGVDMAPLTAELNGSEPRRLSTMMCMSGCDRFTKHVWHDNGWYCAVCEVTVERQG